MPTDEIILVCMRTEDIPIPEVESRIGHCRLCGKPVYMALTAPKHDVVECKQCVMKKISEGDEPVMFLPPTPEQLAEIKEVLGRRKK